jgi:hypothetical protein
VEATFRLQANRTYYNDADVAQDAFTYRVDVKSYLDNIEGWFLMYVEFPEGELEPETKTWSHEILDIQENKYLSNAEVDVFAESIQHLVPDRDTCRRDAHAADLKRQEDYVKNLLTQVDDARRRLENIRSASLSSPVIYY